MTDPQELHALIDALSEGERERARSFLISLLHEQAGDETDAELDALEADPAAKGRLQEMIRLGLEQSQQGLGHPADEVFAELRARIERRGSQ